MIEIGNSYPLKVVKTVDFGYFLDAGELGEVLLPRKHAPSDLAVGDTLEVFLYFDSENRPVATPQVPKARVGEFACLRVVASTEVGAFLDWGLDKDLFVPFAEQHRPLQAGQACLVYLYIDRNDGRIVASSRIDRFLADDRPHRFKPRQEVDLIIANTTDLGFKAIVNHSHWGVLYKDEVHQRLSFGQSIKGYIKQIRADGKIDLTLQGGQPTRDRHAATILDYLEKQGGFAPLHDKSDPRLISRLLGMSKVAFKKAIGGLYKQRLIRIEKDGIRLTGKRPPEKKPAVTTADIWKQKKS